MAAARRKASVASHIKDNEHPRTLVNEVTGDVDGKASMSPPPSVHALLDLDEMYVGEFYQY